MWWYRWWSNDIGDIVELWRRGRYVGTVAVTNQWMNK